MQVMCRCKYTCDPNIPLWYSFQLEAYYIVNNNGLNSSVKFGLLLTLFSKS